MENTWQIISKISSKIIAIFILKIWPYVTIILYHSYVKLYIHKYKNLKNQSLHCNNCFILTTAEIIYKIMTQSMILFVLITIFLGNDYDETRVYDVSTSRRLGATIFT